MAALLNAMAVLVNVAGGQTVDPTLYFAQADQITARIEVVYPQHRIVEELHVVYDSALNLVKYEHALEFTTHPSRAPSFTQSVFDLTAGISYDMDQTSGSCTRNIKAAIASPSSSLTRDEQEFEDRYHLLKVLAPNQLFTITGKLNFVRKTSIRGIEADMWTMDLDQYYMGGFLGLQNTRQTLYTMARNSTRRPAASFSEAKPALLLQRSITLLRNNTSNPSSPMPDQSPLMIINYFDFEYLTVPRMLDFSILACSTSRALEPKAEIQLVFEGQLSTAGFGGGKESSEVVQFRRDAWIAVTSAANISTVRSVGNFWSHDDFSTYFTTVILPEVGSPITAAEAVNRISEAITSSQLKVQTKNGTTLTAVSLRRNVSLLSSTKGEKTSEIFVLYKAYTVLAGSAITEKVHKLTLKQCLQRCQEEDEFVCHTVSTCGYGDCYLSKYHGDELAFRPAEAPRTADGKGTDGKYHLANHSHCAVWTRVWSSEYVQASAYLSSSLQVLTSMDFAVSEETCAKQCSFNSDKEDSPECRSFLWCSKNSVPKARCTLYGQHVTDNAALYSKSVTNNRRNNGDGSQAVDGVADMNAVSGCHLYTQNYMKDFVPKVGHAFAVESIGNNFAIAEYKDRERSTYECARECLDTFGDDRCLSMEMCSADPLFDGDKEVPKIATGYCRISSGYVPSGSSNHRPSNHTVPNENCILFARTQHLDGTPITYRTAGTFTRLTSLGKRGLHGKQEVLNGEESGCCGYSGVEMAILAIAMLIIGALLVLLSVTLAKKFFPSSRISFVRMIS
ncbi:hypothetical protein RvY_14127 [Ramazzottius varieornatus]|uniref:LolA-like domain-containing protein n=1 Tax=Ramazzottius varieornatus TaxID=947166 RepID=A0A1D1VXK2_RAMVA|nr:hypothetical protein RvY_14127 [Ramazzottius varieornatus]